MFQATSVGEAYWPSSRLNPCAATRRIEPSLPAPIQIGGGGLDNDIFEPPIFSAMREGLVGGPRREDDIEAFVEARIGLLHRYAEPGELVVAIALADAN